MPLLRPFLLLTTCLSLPLASLAAQAPEEPALTPDVVAKVDGQEVTLEAYKDYLYQRLGKRPLQGLIDSMLVEQEALRYGVTAEEGEVQKRFEERYQQALRGKSPEDFADGLRNAGQSPAAFLNTLRQDVTQEVLLDGLVLATRVLTDARLQQAFEQQYGIGGQKVEVKQILVMPHFLRAELIRGGKKPAEIDQLKVRLQAKKMAMDCLDRLRAGADWSAMVAEYSHDQVSRKDDGRLPAYRPGLYGPNFTAAVQNQAVGEYSEVIESGAGYHIVQVADRTLSKLADVRAELQEKLLSAAPDWQEREATMNALRGRAKIQRW